MSHNELILAARRQYNLNKSASIVDPREQRIQELMQFTAETIKQHHAAQQLEKNAGVMDDIKDVLGSETTWKRVGVGAASGIGTYLLSGLLAENDEERRKTRGSRLLISLLTGGLGTAYGDNVINMMSGKGFKSDYDLSPWGIVANGWGEGANNVSIAAAKDFARLGKEGLPVLYGKARQFFIDLVNKAKAKNEAP